MNTRTKMFNKLEARTGHYFSIDEIRRAYRSVGGVGNVQGFLNRIWRAPSPEEPRYFECLGCGTFKIVK